MAFTKRTNEYKCSLYGQDVVFKFKRATPEQEAQYFDSMTGYDSKKKDLINQYSFACVELFDEIVENIDGATMIDVNSVEKKFDANITAEDIAYLSDGQCKKWNELIPVSVKIDAMTALYPRVETDSKKL